MTHKKFKHVRTVKDISEYKLKSNGLTVLYKHIPDTGVVTTNITYLVGARDENIGETGLAHMLEHMVFKPTSHDLKRKHEGGAMRFERETGSILNANTWKDRTTYYFSYDAKHFSRALQIEAERMRDVVLTDKEFQPERTNVLSEFDMYNGEPEFAIAVDMVSSAFHCHPYGHETIGYRQDIERYTTTKLQRFYDHFYRPNNATLMVVGDIDLEAALNEIVATFGHLEPEPQVEVRPEIIEPKQEGLRRVEIVRPGTTNLLAIGIKHDGFPTKEWFTTMVTFKLLAGGKDGLLQKALVDTGLASDVSTMQEPTKDANLGIIYITLADGVGHEEIEKKVFELISKVDANWIKKRLKAIITKAVSSELFGRDSSLSIVGELTEYVSAGDWTVYFKTEEILKKITVKEVQNNLKTLFTENNLTIGTYKSI
ncbi:MAG: insulinase family protein [Candidatus Nomurabacteria bacterium]|nr:insulinase family protein [Candidatus Nomurabacteria bacterium]USN87936.1 MAG: insulinase family protein [Candidatus Nomurabacteria bacterium]